MTGSDAHGFKHHRIESRGILLHAVEAGGGPLLVLVSGWPQTWYSWRKIMPTLARHFRVVAVDLPGLGDSDFPESYDTGAIALHLDAVLDAFGGESCLLVTHDIGAWVGYAYAARRHERVRRLVLMDAAIPGLVPMDVFRFAPETVGRVWHFYFNAIAGLPELLIAGREREFLDWVFRNKTIDHATAFDDDALDTYAQAYAPPGRWSGGMGYYRAIHQPIAQNQASAAVPLTMPILAIGGSAGLGDAMAKTMTTAATDVRSAIIPDCGHYLAEERPAELLDVLLPFCLQGA